MNNWTTTMKLVCAVVLIFPLLFVISYGILQLPIDFWWYRAQGYTTYFLIREGYRDGANFFGCQLFVAFFFYNLWVTRQLAGVYVPPVEAVNPPKMGWFRRWTKTRNCRVYLPLTLFLTLPVVGPIFDNWETALLYFTSSSAGVDDPIYGRDISYYLFNYPFFKAIQGQLLTAFSLLLFVLGGLYWYERRPLPKGTPLPDRVKYHLILVLIAMMLLQTWGIFLVRYELLYVDSNMPLFYGPGLVEMRYLLPLVMLGTAAFLIASSAAISYIVNRQGRKVIIIAGLVFISALLLYKFPYIPHMMHRYMVTPNPLKTEKAYIDDHIVATLNAYGLDKITTEDFVPNSLGSEPLSLNAQRDLANIPIWQRDLLPKVYNQLQGIRSYYNFPAVDVGRYTVNGSYQQVNLAAREINIDKLPDEAAQSWENRYLRYTHGYGAVITPSSQIGSRPMRCFLCNISLNSDEGFSIKQPQIYYGLEDYEYAIVPNKLKYSGSESTTEAHYQGTGGIGIKSIFSKALFALYQQQSNIFFSASIDRHSRILLHRNIVDRVRKLAPFLAYDNDPYLVVKPDRLYWVIDAYTLSDDYPAALPYEFKFNGDTEAKKFNYIRNSVKVIIDAYDGTTNFYIVDESDPVIKAYDRLYIDLFKPRNAIPEPLRAHLRYPRDLFHIQMALYTKYHQTNPTVYYQQSEAWSVAKTGGKEVKPYYLTLHRPGIEQQIYTQLLPMTFVNQDNLSALAMAGCYSTETCKNGINRELVIYRFNTDLQVDGPAQVDALINQNPNISKQFTLWDQKGSQIIRGRMIVLPVENTLLYVQPIYMMATKNAKFPQLVRVIVVNNGQGAMDVSLEGALRKLRIKHQSTPLDDPSANLAPANPLPKSNPSEFRLLD